MATITKWEPFAEMTAWRNGFDRLFDEAWRGARMSDRARRVPIDVYDTPDEVVVLAELPGMKPEDVEITMERGQLTISAKRPALAADAQRRELHRELWEGEWRRSVLLPDNLDESKAQASYEHGVLTLRVPKAEEAKPRQIKIHTVKQK